MKDDINHTIKKQYQAFLQELCLRFFSLGLRCKTSVFLADFDYLYIISKESHISASLC